MKNWITVCPVAPPAHNAPKRPCMSVVAKILAKEAKTRKRTCLRGARGGISAVSIGKRSKLSRHHRLSFGGVALIVRVPEGDGSSNGMPLVYATPAKENH